MKKTIVISLGGSVLAPSYIDTNFLADFRKLILKFSKKNNRFVIICGGGKTAREYMSAASKIVRLTDEDLDWLGIHATRLNAQLLRNIFRPLAYPKVIRNPREKVDSKAKIIIAAGWKPGRSTDHMAVMLAKNFKAKTVINITNIDHVYDKNPSEFKNAQPIGFVKWQEFRKLIGATRWSPGLNTPFDPVASRTAQQLNLSVAIMGKNLNTLKNFMMGKKFNGTLIR